MCKRRLALVVRYNLLRQHHAQRVLLLSELVAPNRSDEWEAAVMEVETTRKAVEDAYEKLMQHTRDHGCMDGESD